MAVQYTQEITLDINSNGPYPTVSAKQGDTGRIILAKLTEDNISYILQEGTRAFIRCRKPDGHGIINQANAIIGTNQVEISLSAQTLAIAGRAYADLVLYDENNNILSTISFIIIIMSAPSVAEQATSSDEFGYLQEVVDTANDVINEAESWARGTKVNVSQVSEYYEIEIISASVFDLLKVSLYTYDSSTEEYISVSLDATYDPDETYYALTAGDINNAKYYAEQAKGAYTNLENLSVSAQTLPTGSSAIVNKTVDAQTGQVNLDFGLPAGIQGTQGERGPGTVWVNENEPSDPDINVWINTAGTPTPLLVTADQVSFFDQYLHLPVDAVYNINQTYYIPQTYQQDDSVTAENFDDKKIDLYILENNIYTHLSSEAVYDSEQTYYIPISYQIDEDVTAENFNTKKYNLYIMLYLDNTIGKAVQILNSNIGQATQAAINAGIAAQEATEAASQVGEIDSRVTQLENTIVTKIDDPELVSDSGILYAEKDENNEVTLSWKKYLSYRDDLSITSLPKINNETVYGDKQLSDFGIAPAAPTGSEYYIKPSSGIPSSHLDGEIRATLEKVDTGVYTVIINDEQHSSQDGVVNLGHFLSTSNIVNKNYLDNPWFTISQRGFKTYSGQNFEGQYIYDRWKILKDQSASYYRTINAEEGRLTISASPLSDSSEFFAVGQILSDDVWKALGGKTVCFSINYTFGTSYITYFQYFTCPEYNSNPDPDAHKYRLDQSESQPKGWGIQLFVDTINSVKHLVCRIFWQGSYGTGSNYVDSNIYIEKIKLELGNFTTINTEGAPIYSEELERCKKYFQYYGGQTAASNNPDNIDIILGYGIARDSVSLDITFNGLGGMVTIPSVILADGINLQARRGLIAVNTTNQPIDIVQSALNLYAVPSTVLTAATFTNDVYYLEDNGVYTVASEFDSTTAGSKLYYRKTYRNGLENNLYATVDRNSATAFASWVPYYVVLPRTVPVGEGETEVISYIQFSAEP